MNTIIYTLSDKANEPEKKALYTISPRKALVFYIMQTIFNNWNTWEYPEIINGMRESTKAKDHWYYDDLRNQQVIAAYPV